MKFRLKPILKLLALLNAENAALQLDSNTMSAWFDLPQLPAGESSLRQQQSLMPDNLFDSNEDINLMMRAVQGFISILLARSVGNGINDFRAQILGGHFHRPSSKAMLLSAAHLVPRHHKASCSPRVKRTPCHEMPARQEPMLPLAARRNPKTLHGSRRSPVCSARSA